MNPDPHEIAPADFHAFTEAEQTAVLRVWRYASGFRNLMGLPAGYGHAVSLPLGWIAEHVGCIEWDKMSDQYRLAVGYTRESALAAIELARP